MRKEKYTVTVERNADPGYKIWTVTLSQRDNRGSYEKDFHENHLPTALRKMAEAINEHQKF